jgi:hypothetical protein
MRWHVHSRSVSYRQEVLFMSENSMQSPSHIDSIVRQEEEALERRSSAERLADAVGGLPEAFPSLCSTSCS